MEMVMPVSDYNVSANTQGLAPGGSNLSTSEFWMYGVLLPCIAIPGVLGNLASLFIFTRPSMQSSLNTYLAGLSVFDGVLLLLSLLIYPPVAYCLTLHSSSLCAFLTFSVVATYPISLIAQFGSIWTCVAITTDRFLAINYPLRKHRYCTRQIAGLVLAGISFIGLLYRIPVMLELRIEGNSVRATPLRHSRLYITVYRTLAYSLLMFAVPFTLMILLNLSLIRSLRKSEDAAVLRFAINVQRAVQRWRCTLITILVSATFLVLNVLAIINKIIEAWSMEEDMLIPYDNDGTKRQLIFLGNLLICLNSAMNIVIYYGLGKIQSQCPCQVHVPDNSEKIWP